MSALVVGSILGSPAEGQHTGSLPNSSHRHTSSKGGRHLQMVLHTVHLPTGCKQVPTDEAGTPQTGCKQVHPQTGALQTGMHTWSTHNGTAIQFHLRTA